MTTAHTPRGSGSAPGVAGRVVRRALLATVLLTGLLAGIAGALAGSAALVGVAVGAGLVCGFFGLGALVLLWVTRVSPAATLMVGLMTYTLQVVGLAAAFAALRSSGALGTTVDAAWLGGTVIAGTVVWLAIQVTLSMRARQPYFDAPAQAPDEPSDAASDQPSDRPSEHPSPGRPGGTEAGAR